MIRPATIDDLDVLVEGNLALAQETENLSLDRATVTRGVRAVLLEERPGAYRVAESEGRVSAQLLLTYEWSDWRAASVWWVQSVYVWPDRRRQGLYRLLYRAVRAEAVEAGAAGLRLYVESGNQLARETYASLGMNGARYTVYEDLFSEH